MLQYEILGNHCLHAAKFEEFVGKEVKAPYRDGTQFRIAKGKLVSIAGGFLKIKGKLGTIVINEKNIEKMSLAKN